MKEALAVIGAIAVVAFIGTHLPPEPTPAERAAQERARIAELEVQTAQLEAEAETARTLRPWRSLAWTVLVWVIVALFFVGLWVVVYTVWSRRDYTVPRSDGRLPVRLREVPASEAIASAHAAQRRDLAVASNTGVPESISVSYAPSFRNHQDIQGGDPPILPVIPPPPFAQIPIRTDSVVLGHDGHELVTRPWDHLQSLAIGGTTGTGKTWTGVSLVLQALHAGHRVALIDPHAADSDSLAARLEPAREALWRPTAVRTPDAASTIEAFGRLIEDRGQGVDMDRTPCTLVIDEFTRFMRGDTAEAMAVVLEGVVSEGRKLGVRCILLGQRWSASRTGGSGDLRDVIPNVIMHRMKRKDALMLSGLPTDECPDTMSLQPGECYLLEGEETVRVTQPRLGQGDVAAFVGSSVRVVGPPSVRRGSVVGPPSVREAGPGMNADLPRTYDGPTTDLRADLRIRVLDLFRAGDSLAEITDQIAGTRQRSGGKWKTCRTEVEAIIRKEIQP